MQLQAVATTSRELAATSARGAKVDRLSRLLAGTGSRAETAVVVSWLSGELPQRQIGVGWAGLRELPPAAAEPSLTVPRSTPRWPRSAPVRRRVAGQPPGSWSARCSAPRPTAEQRFLRGLITGELRQGALAGLMADAIARAAGDPAGDVRRAAMLSGDLARWPRDALHDGAAALAGFRCRSAGRSARCWPRPRPASARRCDKLGRRGRRVEARRHPGAGAPRRRHVSVFTRTPGRHHRPGAGGRGGRAGAAGAADWCSTARLIALDADGRPAAVPGHLGAGRPATRRRGRCR